MNTDVAIVGMAGRFPEADSLEKLYENLCAGKDSVNEISSGRIAATTLPADRQYQPGGYLEGIHFFDHALFNISMAEAQTMDPHQRLLLEVIYSTFENAAYNADDLKGSNTAVFVADSSLEYYKHADEFVPTLATGNTKAFLASRINRHFDLRGGVMMVDTTCSSSLVVLHLACNALILGEADYALACGVNLNLFPFKGDWPGLELDSPDGKSRAFSAKADGMSTGEAVACVLLKPLDKALRDNDIIHAVVKGVAINSNAGRASSLTAPDSTAQADVLRRAWDKAGVNPEMIGFIEAHGSGTKLGDSIEVGGLTEAFRSYTPRKQFCALSTIKSNIGHTRAAAGITGLLKTVLALKHRVKFPAIHFEEPNPMINFRESAVYVNSQLLPWEADGRKRYAGVTSIGLSGTNCHAVLAEAPGREATPGDDPDKEPNNQLVTVSAQTPEGLVNNLRALHEKLSSGERYALADISYTLCTGRKHYGCRAAFTPANLEALRGQLGKAIDAGAAGVTRASETEKLILVFADLDAVPGPLVDFYRARYEVFSQQYDHCLRVYGGGDKPVPLLTFVFQFSLYKLFEACGIHTDRVLGIGVGRTVTEVILNELSLEEGLESAALYEKEAMTGLQQRVDRLVAREVTQKPVGFLAMGPRDPIAGLLEEKAADNKNVLVHCLPEAATGDPVADVLQFLYLSNYPLDWRSFKTLCNGKKIELPGYQFSPVPCWIREAPRLGKAAAGEAGEGFTFRKTSRLKTEGTEMEQLVGRYWCELLAVEEVLPEDHFFEIGGDSILATKMVNKINKDFSIRLDFEDVFDFPTLRGFAGFLSRSLDTKRKVAAFWKEVLKLQDVQYSDNFFQLGGHSLIANQLIVRIKKEFGIQLNFEDFFRNPTIELLSACVDNALLNQTAGKSPQSITPVAEQAYYDVSSAQKRLWITWQLNRNTNVYNQPSAYELKGNLDREALSRAFAALVDRHEILRTAFVVVDGEPKQKLRDPGASGCQVHYLDLTGHQNAQDREDIARTTALNDANFVFNLENDCLIRMGLIRLEEARYLLLFNTHHIVSDSWSMEIMAKDISALYNAFASGKENPLPPLHIQYKDYAYWHNALLDRKGNDHQRYWLNVFGQKPPALPLPTRQDRATAPQFVADSVHFTLDEASGTALHAACQHYQISKFMFLLASLKALLHCYTNSQDLVVGVPVAGRDHPDLEDQVGFYLNILALRSGTGAAESFDTLLKKLNKTTLEAYDHQAYPIDRLIDELGFAYEPGRNPLFDVGFNYNNVNPVTAQPAQQFDGLALERIDSGFRTAKADIWFNAYENGKSIDFEVDYNANLFEREFIQELAGAFAFTVNRLVENPEIRMDELSRVTKVYQQESLRKKQQASRGRNAESLKRMMQKN